MTSPFITGPNALYRNIPIEPEYFQPSVFVILNILRGQTTTVTTTTDNNYVIGQLVRFLLPAAFGIRQINEQLAYVIATPAVNQFVADLDSLHFDPFIPIPLSATTLPQVVAVGDINTGVISSTGRVVPSSTIPGAFINISPI